MPYISVIIPVYNQAHYIRDAVKSVATQTYTDWELVVVDDGSTDNSPSVLSELASSVPRTSVIRQENQGRAAARNTGLEAAAGSLIVFLDADDQLYPHKLERQVTFLQEHPDVGVVYSDVMLCDETGQELVRHSLANMPHHPSGRIVESLFLRNSIPIHSAMVRRTCIEQAGVFDENLPQGTEDWDFWIRLACHCRFQYQAEALGLYRVHGAMITHASDQMWRSFTALQDKITRMPEFIGAPKRIRSHFYRICGVALGMRGDMPGAQEHLRRSIRLFPQDPGALALLMLSYLGRDVFRRSVLLKRWIERIQSGRPASPIQPPW